MIPFYENRLQSLSDELYRAEDARKKDNDHIKFLKATIKDIRNKRNNEKRQVKKLGIDCYEKWLELKDIRHKQGFQSSTVELKAREFDLPGGKKEIVFYLNQTEIPSKSLSGKSIPSSEVSRRKKVKQLQASVDIYINDKLVDTSRPANVSWPNFEADFGDQFLLFLYTMPKSIELRLKIQNKEVSRIPIEVPGTKVEALTSSYALVREVKFSRNEYKAKLQQEKDKKKGTYIKQEEKEAKREERKIMKFEKQEEKKLEKELKRKAKNPNAPQIPGQANQPPANPQNPQPVPGAVAAPNGPNAPIEAAGKKIEESKTADQIQKEKWEAMIKGPDIQGYIYFKSEWKGEGGKMPPAIRLLLEREYKDEVLETTKMVKHRVIDINDPRYDYIIKQKKEENEHLKKLIEKDSMNPLHDLQPFRHIQLINQDTHYELVNLDIPILEQEVVSDPALSYLIEKFSKMGALQTYDQMLREVNSFSGSERLQDMSTEVLERRQKFLEKIKRVQKDIKTGKNKPNVNYRSIIREVGGIEASNPFAGLVEKAFAPRRKLRPTVKNKATVAISQCSEASIKVQIVSGINIPVRKESIQAIEELRRQMYGGQNQPNQRPPGAPLDRNVAYPGYPGDAGYPEDGYGGRDPYDNQYGRDPGASFNQGFNRGPSAGTAPNRRGATMDYNRGFGQGDRSYSRGYNSAYPPGGGMIDDRMAASGAIGGALADRNAPPYSGYGAVENPYGTMRPGYGGFGGGQLAPPGGLRDPSQMGAINKAKMELTGPNKLIQGSVFIEVRYTSNRPGSEVPQIRRTRECNGSFPDWNETLSFDIKPANGRQLTEDELINCSDTLYFSIYDKHETEKRIAMTNKHEVTVENKFLGSFSIPLLSILQNSPKMEGHIRIDRPINLQGYGMLPSGMLSSNIFKGDIDTDLLPSYISLSVNLDPLMELPAENEYDFYPGGENAKLLRAGAIWANTYRQVKQGPPKIVKMFGENVERKSILLCRFLRSQAPPKKLIDLRQGTKEDERFAIQKAARFVSLIPFVDDSKAFENIQDMWCTSQEFLDFNGGDYEEHAILLCNYFNYIDGILNEGKIESYIILGNAVPEGYTTYVLRRNIKNNHVEIWDALKGQAYFFGKKKETYRFCFCLPLGTGYRERDPEDEDADKNFLLQQNVS